MSWSPQAQPPAPTPPRPPQQLSEIPPEHRAVETFGWFPGAVAVAGIIVCGGCLADVAQYGMRSLEPLEYAGGGLLAALVFGAWELVRRARRASLVFYPNRSIAVYKRGALGGVVPFGQLTWFRLSVINTIRELILFGVIALSCGLAALTLGFGGRYGFWVLALALGGGLALASSIYSRALCVHYIVPGAGTVVLAKTRLRRVAGNLGLPGI